MQHLEDIGVADAFDEEDLYPTSPGWFVAMNQALKDALGLVGGAHGCNDCPVARYVEHREKTPRIDR